MAELTVFGFRQGTSLLHRLDVRFKLIFLVLISLSSLNAQVAGLSLLTLILVVALINIRVSLGSILRDLRYASVLLIFIFVARALSTSGSAIVEFKIISITREGLYEGALVCWRLVIVIITGLAFVLTTRPSEIKAAVAWILRPFPFVPAKRIATMMSLIVRFMPVIFQQAKETLDAQRARGVENRKNPVYRLVKLGIPILRRTFERADKLALAMEARCYSENRTDPQLASGIKDWIALFAVVFLCSITII
ncbi:MAG: energy-coupling factor transporter transmembrane protein EcfT [Deltaproteobacteria bacterium]|jgi:biotin transport system permease protein|nr:energy-coupling factor transporter transmembrane protein EcfT [Deltaproteobacteria bacterium]